MTAPHRTRPRDVGPPYACDRPPRPRSAALCAALAAALLPACSSVDWVKSRFTDAPPATTAGAPAAAAAPAPVPAAAAAGTASGPASAAPPPATSFRRRLRDAPAAPPPAAAVPPPAAVPAPPAAAAPPAAVAAPVATAPSPAAPVALPPAPPPAPLPAPAPVPVPVPPPAVAPVAAVATAPATAPAPSAASELAPGHHAVQVGVFMTPASAESQRSRVAAQLRAAALPEAEATRVLRRDDRYYVLVGDLVERAQAEALAAQVRQALQRDVLIFRR